MNASAKKLDQEESLKLLDEAKKCVRKSKGDRDAAAKMLEAVIRRTASYREDAIVIAARYLTRQIEYQARTAAAFVPATMPSDDTAWAAVAERQKRELFDTYMLPNGTPLGDAKREDLKAAIEFHRMQETGNKASRRFYEAILNGLRGKQTVRQHYTAAEITKLHKEHKKC